MRSPRGQKDRLHRGQVVRGKLHDERGRLAREHLGLLEHDAGDDDGDDAEEVEHRRDPPRLLGVAAGDGAEHERDDGHLRAAGDHGRRHDGHATVALVLDGLGGHDGGHAAAGRHEHGDEALAGQAEAAEYAVHDERHAGQISAALQEREQQEQDDHLRNEADNGAHAGHDAVHDQALHPVGHLRALKRVADDGSKAGDHRPNSAGSGSSSAKAASSSSLAPASSAAATSSSQAPTASS